MLSYLALVRPCLSSPEGQLDRAGKTQIEETGKALNDIFSETRGLGVRLIAANENVARETGKIIAVKLGLDGKMLEADYLVSGSPASPWGGSPLNLERAYGLIRTSEDEGIGALVLVGHKALITTLPGLVMDRYFSLDRSGELVGCPGRGQAYLLERFNYKWTQLPSGREITKVYDLNYLARTRDLGD